MSQRSADVDTPVLIVGAGPVGLALAGDLGWRNTSCTVIERSDGSIYQPKMDLVGIRTMEHCRRWGIVDWVEGSPYPIDYPQDNVYVTALAGYELGRERFASYADSVNPTQSPQRRHRCPQDLFDPILRRFASSFPHVTLAYETELVSLAQSDERVEATVRDPHDDRTRVISARYLVGCDGAGSAVRDAAGIGMHGKGALTHTTNVIFRSEELVRLHDKGLAYRFIVIGPEGTWATVVAISGGDRWRLSIIGDDQPRTLSDDEIDQAIRRAVGVENFEFEVLTVVPWIRRELVATSYRSGRVLIAGDAAHVMSPTGGFGMNTGIGDAVDLSWKLAGTLAGWGGEGLLDSYEPERRPVAERNISEASGNLARMLSPRKQPPGPVLLDDTPEGDQLRRQVGEAFSAEIRREWHTLGIHLGYRYEVSPICWPDGTPAPPYEVMTYAQSARPGSRAPHVWLSDGRSTLDLFGCGFVLLRLGARPPAGDTLVKAAAQRDVPLRVVTLDEPVVEQAYEMPLVLVRPDGHVAWRSRDDPADAVAVIDVVRGAARWSDAHEREVTG